MYFQPKSLLNITLLMAVMATSGCKTRLDADFEADTVGLPPAQAPASPEDDSIFVLDAYGRGSAIVTNSGALSGSKSLRLNGPGSIPASGTFGTIVYMYAEALEYEETIYVSWTGKLSAGAGAEVVLSNGHFESMVRVELRSNQFRINGAVAGNYSPNQEHVVLITVGRDGRFSASISGTGASGSVSNRPLLADLESNAVQLVTQLLGGTASRFYLIDDVNLSEDEPE